MAAFSPLFIYLMHLDKNKGTLMLPFFFKSLCSSQIFLASVSCEGSLALPFVQQVEDLLQYV